MAFGIPGTESSSSGGSNEFLGRIQFDARSGLWKHVTRMEEGGRYFNSESEDYMNPSFLMDFGTLEVGYAKLSGIPSFALVPFGALMPQWSEEINPEGKRAYVPAVRMKVLSPKTFGDDSPRYFLLNSKTGLPAMQEAWIAFAASPEAASGMIPVAQTSVKTVEVRTPGGLSKFKVPVFNFIAWIERPASLGERITAVPDSSTGLPIGAHVSVVMAARAPVAAPAPVAARANHVPAPAPVSVAVPPPAPVAANAAAPW